MNYYLFQFYIFFIIRHFFCLLINLHIFVYILNIFYNNKAIIGNKFDHIKKIQIAQILIPRFIPRDYMGEPFNGITPIYNSHNTITLSYYPGININNTVISVTDLNDISTKIEVLELVDLNNKKIYLLSINYNNPYYLSKYINIKAELYSYLNINNLLIELMGKIHQMYH